MFIPDPTDPEARAIDTETGEVCGGVFVAMLSDLSNPHAPTLNELRQHGKHVGYTRGVDWAGRSTRSES